MCYSNSKPIESMAILGIMRSQDTKLHGSLAILEKLGMGARSRLSAQGGKEFGGTPPSRTVAQCGTAPEVPEATPTTLVYNCSRSG